MNALPQIRSVTYTSGLHIVNFELDSRLLPFVNSISVFHTSEGDPSNIRITTLPTATYSSATPSIGIQDIPTNQRTNFYLNSSIDNVIYISDKVDFDALTSQVCKMVRLIISHKGYISLHATTKWFVTFVVIRV